MRSAWMGVASGALMMASACVPTPRMCASPTDCSIQAFCVAGRCLRRGAIAEINAASRRVFAPEEVGYVVAGRARGAAPALVAFGLGDGAMGLLRFAISLPRDVRVVEAYVLMARAPTNSDAATLALRAVGIAGAWDGASVTRAAQPPLEDFGAPTTTIVPGGRFLRLDVRALVERWRERAGRAFGIAVVADGVSRSGILVAMRPTPGPAWSRDGVLSTLVTTPGADTPPPVSGGEWAGAPEADVLPGPQLELYVK